MNLLEKNQKVEERDILVKAYDKQVKKLCKINKKRFNRIREAINTLDDTKDKYEILSMLEDVEKSFTDPLFINMMVDVDMSMGKQKTKKFYQL